MEQGIEWSFNGYYHYFLLHMHQYIPTFCYSGQRVGIAVRARAFGRRGNVCYRYHCRYGFDASYGNGACLRVYYSSYRDADADRYARSVRSQRYSRERFVSSDRRDEKRRANRQPRT